MKAARRLLVVLAVVAAWPALAVQETAETYQGPAAEAFLQKARISAPKEMDTGITLPKV